MYVVCVCSPDSLLLSVRDVEAKWTGSSLLRSFDDGSYSADLMGLFAPGLGALFV